MEARPGYQSLRMLEWMSGRLIVRPFDRLDDLVETIKHGVSDFVVTNVFIRLLTTVTDQEGSFAIKLCLLSDGRRIQ